MTFETKELSVYDAEPLELYEFTYANKAWRYTSSDEEQSYLSTPYLPLQIQRGNIDQTMEINRSDITIEVPRDVELAQEFFIYPPAEVMLVRIYQQHRGEQDTALAWIGRVLSCEWTGSIASLKCESVFTSQRRTGLKRLYGTQCPHVLYGDGCRVNQNDFKTEGTVDQISSNVLTVSAIEEIDSGYFNGGMLVFVDEAGITHKRAVTDHTDTIITMSSFIRQLGESDLIALYPGCKHNLGDCENKFSNLINYGGCPYSPPLNPFDGKTLF